jgi:Mrp family chromosome partitioning ATPase
MSAMRFRALLLRQWWLIAICVVGAGVGTLAGSLFLFPSYQSSVLVDVDLRGASLTTATILLSNRTISSNVQLAQSDSVLAHVAAKYKDLSVGQLKSEVSASALPNAQVFRITVQDSNAVRAASLANDIALALVDLRNAEIARNDVQSEKPIRAQMDATTSQINQVRKALAQLGSPPADPTQAAALSDQLSTLEDQLAQQKLTLSRIQVAEATDAYMLSVQQQAQPSTTPMPSRVAVAVSSGLASGLLLGILVALLIDRVSRRRMTLEDVVAILGCPVLAELGPMQISDADGMTVQAEYDALGGACRALARALDFSSITRSLRTVAITSASRSTTASAIASTLSLYMAAIGKRVLLIDAHVSNGRQAMQFGIPRSPGLSNAALDIRASASHDVSIYRYMFTPQRVHAPLLQVIPDGSPAPNPREVFGSDAMRRVLASAVAAECDLVIVDAPPAMSPRVCGTLAGCADGVLVFVDLRSAREDMLARMRVQLAESGVTTVGCVISSDIGLESERVPQAPVTPTQSRGGTVETLFPLAQAQNSGAHASTGARSEI